MYRQHAPLRTHPGTPMGILERAQPALILLWQAQGFAHDLQRPVWDFAVEMECLRAIGLTNNDLRWLLGRDLVEHAHETTMAGEERRTFSPLGKMTLTLATCFVLTPSGIALVSELAKRDLSQVAVPIFVASDHDNNKLDLPVWNRDRQELRLQGALVKQFKLPAPNQEIVLAAFEEESWPIRIDDPLPGHQGVDAKRRLHETITSLNRNQKKRLIQFMGDGSGQGVRWERLLLAQSNATH